MTEVRRETESKNIGDHTTEMRATLDKESKEREALEREEKRKFDDKQEALREAREKYAFEREALKHIESRQLASSFLSDMQSNIFQNLEQNGFFVDPLEKACASFLEGLKLDVFQVVDDRRTAKSIADSLIQAAVARVRAEASEDKAVRDAKRAAELEELRQRKMFIQLFIHSDYCEKPVGPLRLQMEATIADVQKQVLAWMKTNIEELPEFKEMTFKLADGQQLKVCVCIF